MLSVYCNDNQENWDVFIPIVLFAYRTSVQKTLHEIPYRLLYGWNPQSPSDIDKWSPNAWFVGRIDEAWKQSNELRAKQAERSTLQHKEKHKSPPI